MKKGGSAVAHTLKTPLLTVDVIVRFQGGIILIERKNPPPGWALPGGFVDVGESVEEAAVREAREETSLDVRLIEQFHVYSSPDRDPRFHTVSVVFIGDGTGVLEGRDDAARAAVFTADSLPSVIAFDHGRIISDYFRYRQSGRKPPVG
ncbi:MAG TPA: NUDIX hydrolase [Deltaproteobacteria bacterium]|nr:NUDIX hydrolase [Deltaproteobacteria bacterium]